MLLQRMFLNGGLLEVLGSGRTLAQPRTVRKIEILHYMVLGQLARPSLHVAWSLATLVWPFLNLHGFIQILLIWTVMVPLKAYTTHSKLVPCLSKTCGAIWSIPKISICDGCAVACHIHEFLSFAFSIFLSRILSFLLYSLRLSSLLAPALSFVPYLCRCFVPFLFLLLLSFCLSFFLCVFLSVFLSACLSLFLPFFRLSTSSFFLCPCRSLLLSCVQLHIAFPSYCF